MHDNGIYHSREGVVSGYLLLGGLLVPDLRYTLGGKERKIGGTDMRAIYQLLLCVE